MQTIPLSVTPSQSLHVLLGGQNVGLTLRQRSSGLYADIKLNGSIIGSGLLCQDRTLINNAPYTGFSGDLVFVDTMGANDPTYDYFGSRYVLYWIEPGESIP
ncbi:phage baseplate plug protein [Acetobacter sp. P5B1]|uniref:phage baseplate plug family protein n=1 Tax=Acetobacter sp. P5B1 TaxID=2762620 RepID=UPI001C0411A3|nr:hypothetical protein [Acetobacter sp. P5B1]